MKAVVYTRYGPPEVLRLADVPKPAPRDHEVPVKAHATTVTIGDTIMRSLNLPIAGRQKVLVQAPSSHDLLHHHLRHHLGDWRLVVALDKRIGWFRKPELPSAPVRP
jgi:hypothetical protein